MRVQYAGVARDTETHRAGGNVHVPNADPVRGAGGRQLSVHQRHADSSECRGGAAGVRNVARQDRRAPANGQLFRTGQTVHGLDVMLSAAQTVQIHS